VGPAAVDGGSAGASEAAVGRPAVPLGPLVAKAAAIIRADPGITVCERKCDRCLAASAGGPIG